jgi:hypothetical protein
MRCSGGNVIPAKPPIELPMDLSPDIEWRLNASDDDEKKSA